MTSATEKLRRMLDERGEDYMRNDFGITWSYYSDPHTATESMDGTLIVTGFTPEQAIAATLGQGSLTAEDVRSFLNRNSVFDDTTWTHGRQELVFDEDDLQAMADELNAALGLEPCVIESTRYIESDIPDSWYEFDLSCGHTVKSEQVPPSYCEECGKRIDLQGVSYV